MYIEIFSSVVKIVIACLALAGLYCNSGIIQKKFRKSMFVYFTNLSLVFCFLYFTTAIFAGGGDILNCANGFVILAVTITMVIFHFMLLPARRRKTENYRVHYADMVTHYAVPILTIIDWIIFAEKGGFEYFYPLVWCIPFILYFFMTVLYARNGGWLEHAESRYPYYFIDLDRAGVKKVIRNIFMLFIAIIALGYLLLLFDFLLVRPN